MNLNNKLFDGYDTRLNSFFGRSFQKVLYDSLIMSLYSGIMWEIGMSNLSNLISTQLKEGG
jgi:hypothetical protein